MTVEETHPDGWRLQEFSLGRLTLAERIRIERHLETCSACCALLGNRSDSPDILLDLARQTLNKPEKGA